MWMVEDDYVFISDEFELSIDEQCLEEKEDDVCEPFDIISLDGSDVDGLFESSNEEEDDEEDDTGKVQEDLIPACQVLDLEAGRDFDEVVQSFDTIYDEEKQKKECFLPGVPVSIEIVEATRHVGSHKLNPYLYSIDVIHGTYKWTIKRRCNRISDLHTKLKFYRTALLVQERSLGSKIPKVPRFPHRPEITIKEGNREKRMLRFQKFLRSVVNIDQYRNNKHTLNFLEVSSLSFVKDLGGKEKESEVHKRVGGHTFSRTFFGIGRLDPTWHRRWLVVKRNFVTYLDKDANVIREVMLFDNKFTVSCDQEKTGNNGLLICNSTRNLSVKCMSNRQAMEWMVDIAKMMTKGDEYIRENRYGSFAPPREHSYIKWFVDGKDYFSDVADAILEAKEEIFITDWWLSPEIQLKRYVDIPGDWRLESLLKKQADKGVKIYVLLYKEVEMSLGINSLYSKNKLLQLNSTNIKVLRHPDKLGSTSILLWAHHEKIVCIDQRLCFLGGLDLCYGRWDEPEHRLHDFGSAQPKLTQPETDTAVMKVASLFLNIDAVDSACQMEDIRKSSASSDVGGRNMFVGKDYTNPYVADVTDVEHPYTDYLDRTLIPRMPWHDIACVLTGNAARDAGRHFIQRWNFTKQQKTKENTDVPFLLPKIIDDDDGNYHEYLEGLKRNKVQILRSASEWSCGSQTVDCSILHAYLEHIKKAKYYIYIENQFFITSLKDQDIQNEIGNALIERITRAYKAGETFRVYVVMPLLPSFPGVNQIGEVTAAAMCFVEFWNLSSSRNINDKLKANGIEDPQDYIFFCGLRNYSDLRVKLVTEIIYIHSKLMIVDDAVVIMGSANVNDRSMLGSRDSEIAVCVEDTEMIPGKMDDVDVNVGTFASSLRMQLFKEHLGLLDQPSDDVLDPIKEDFFKDIWKHAAKSNAGIYEKVFKCLPTNEVKSFEELATYKATDDALKSTDSPQARSLLKEIRGFLVEKPLDFLCNQDLRPPTGAKESLVPVSVFT